ncbi:hypothetical protein [Nocardia terpenica]|uniref:Uncharacterized protein n=1 Tax=Nocardia terpenica TaxID=455432 RepID=A0A164H4M8_9NOCA|nr:hypothetical protein [Nocardia terpenica]KZM68196.1 hypothetical protein AWN90_09715 [Nocardia terpenica]NQE88931.1 hypothetical protein [Nocardia terpenica]
MNNCFSIAENEHSKDEQLYAFKVRNTPTLSPMYTTTDSDAMKAKPISTHTAWSSRQASMSGM